MFTDVKLLLSLLFSLQILNYKIQQNLRKPQNKMLDIYIVTVVLCVCKKYTTTRQVSYNQNYQKNLQTNYS